ncbi:MAG: HlyC/CorC family transporter [Phycisphaerae bacterium]|nr:HlyC/CorC family transporter [Phycisphaerae bacterium]
MTATLLIAANDALTWTGIVLHTVALLVLLVLSACFSGSEAVLFSLSPAQVQHDATSSSTLRRLVAWAMSRPRRTLTDILIANTAVNVLLFSASFVFFRRLAEQCGPWISPLSAVFSVLVVIVLGEVVPKVLGVGLAYRLAPYAAILVRATSYPARPLGYLLQMLLVQPTHRLFFADGTPHATTPRDITPEELKALLEMNLRHGVLNPTEDMMLREVINLGYLRARDIMVPRVDIQAFDINAPATQLHKLLRATRLKKVPVYDGSIDNLLGLIHAKVLCFNPQRPIRQLISPVHFVPELITGEQLLHHFRDTRSQLAITIDEYGGVAGLVTLEDLLEHIVGDIYDPDDATEPAEIEHISATEYFISGRLNVQFWIETFGLPHLPERVTTVGGLVTARLGRTARVGDRVRTANVELEVTSVDHRRIERLRLRLIEPPPREPAA